MKHKLLIPLLIMATSVCSAASYTVDKQLRQRFDNVSTAGEMDINSKYGNVNVSQWDRPYAEVTVDISATARNEADARRLLDRITVSFREQGASAYASTEIKSGNGGKNENFEITYQVNIPAGMKMVLDVKYGNVRMGELDGKLDAEIKYGNINVDELKSKDNYVGIKYGNITVANAPRLELDMGYGNLSAGNLGILEINSKYSNIKAGYIGGLDIEGSSYDNYNIGEAVSVRASAGSSELKLGVLHKSLYLPGVKYGNVNVDKVLPGFEQIVVNASYSGVKIAFAEPVFGYELNSRYGSISIKDMDAVNRVEMNGDTSVERTGNAGGYSGNPNVKISVSYGNIELRGR